MSQFDLQNFLPFQLARLSYEVSNQLAQIYSERFDIDIAEWRVLATLAAKQPCTAQAVVSSTRTHKSTISRAVSRLIKTGWIERVHSSDDRREHWLRFSASGQVRFDTLVPLVLEFERDLYARMSKKSVDQITNGIKQLEQVLDLTRNDATSKD